VSDRKCFTVVPFKSKLEAIYFHSNVKTKLSLNDPFKKIGQRAHKKRYERLILPHLVYVVGKLIKLILDKKTWEVKSLEHMEQSNL